MIRDSHNEERLTLAGTTDGREEDWICLHQASDANEAGEDGGDLKEDHGYGETSRCSRWIEEMSSAMVRQDVSPREWFEMMR